MSEKPAPNPQPQGQFWLRQPDASLTGERPDVPSPFQALQKPGDVLPDEHKPEGMRECFRRKIVVPALRGVVAFLKGAADDGCDKETPFYISSPAETDDWIDDGCDKKKTSFHTSAVMLTPFTHEEEEKFLAWLDEHEEELRRRVFEGSDKD